MYILIGLLTYLKATFLRRLFFLNSEIRGEEKKQVTFQNILILTIRRLENYYLFSISELDTLLKLKFSSVKICPEAMAQMARLTN